MAAPLSAAGIQLWVAHFFAAGGTLPERFVFPELDVGPAERAADREDVFRLPITLVLARATFL
jgi:hypothetical protein